VLVAVTVMLPVKAGAVRRPIALMAPALDVQVTAELKLPVPCTDASHWEVVPGAILAGVQVTDTDVMVEEGWVTETVAVPDLVVSWVLVAVTVRLPAMAGAVSSPLDVIVPALTAQVTEEL
jgi:hypothetical protein